jgi:hypothetical protein
MDITDARMRIIAGEMGAEDPSKLAPIVLKIMEDVLTGNINYYPEAKAMMDQGSVISPENIEPFFKDLCKGIQYVYGRFGDAMTSYMVVPSLHHENDGREVPIGYKLAGDIHNPQGDIVYISVSMMGIYEKYANTDAQFVTGHATGLTQRETVTALGAEEALHAKDRKEEARQQAAL